MSDIVKGLYDRAIGHGGDALLMDAADEIERLRSLLREMLDGYCADNLTQQEVERRVREALGGRDE